MLTASRPAAVRIDEVSVQPLQTRSVDGYEVLSVRMPSSGFIRQQENEIRARYHRALGGTRRALVVVVPAFGIPQYPAATLRRHVLHSALSGDVDVLQILGEESLFDWRALRSASDPAELKQIVVQGVKSSQTMVNDVRGLLAWAAQSFDVDSRRVAIVGYSMGASAALQVMAFEPGIAAGVMILPAASLHEVVASCGARVRETRHEIERLQGWTRDEFTDWFEAPLRPIDPLRFVGAIATDRVLLIEAARDQCVPEHIREEIWLGLGRPELITINGGHRTSFLTMTPVGLHATTHKLIAFLEARLGEPVKLPGGVSVAGSQ